MPLNERRLLFLLAAVQFVNVLDFVIMMPLGPLFIADLDINPAQLGLLVSSYTIAAAVSSLALGRWVNRQPRKRSLLISWTVFTIATLLCGVAHNYAALLAARVVAGLSGGPATSVVLTIIADAVPSVRRGRALAFVQSAFSVASVVGVPAGMYLAAWGSWRAPFLVLAGLAAVIWLVLSLRLPRFDGHVAAMGEERSFLTTIRLVLGDKGSRRAYLTHALVMGASFSVVPFFSPYLVNNRGVHADDLGLFYLAGGLLTFVMMQFIGRLTDRFGTLRIYTVVAMALTVVWQLFLWLPVSGLWMVPLFGALMLTNASRMVPLMSLYSKIPPAEIRGAFMSYLSTVQHFASGAGTLVAGVFLTLDAAGKLQNFELAAECTVVIALSVIVLARSLSVYANAAAEPIGRS